MYDFLSAFYTATESFIIYIKFRKLNNLDFDLSGSPRVKYNDAIGFRVYSLLLMFNSNTA